MQNLSRLPAVPLITHDPYFSIWDCGLTPACDTSRHWSGAHKPITCTGTVDGIRVRVFGNGGRRVLPVREIRVTPLTSEYRFSDLGIELRLRFTSPLLPDDPEILSTPVTFVRFSLRSTDGKPHSWEFSFNMSEKNCFSGEIAPRMRLGFFRADDLNVGYMGQLQQKPLSSSGDNLTQDWGNLLFASDRGQVDDNPGNDNCMLRYHLQGTGDFDGTLLVAYDDIASIDYFGRLLPAYYARKGKTIVDAIREFHARETELLSRCDAFDRKLLADAEALGGEEYARICTAAYRQTMAAHKLVEDPEGNLLFISKENDSNGCAATVDVSYPSVPLFLLYCPELVRAMCRPVLKFAKMPVWPFDFAPHDVGRYPTLHGQIYGCTLNSKHYSVGASAAPIYYYPDGKSLFREDRQMPVEESADMLLMLAAAGAADGDYSDAARELPLLRQWCGYLLRYGEDPGEQLCTDDFTGHLARNVNLSAKAIMGIAAFARILEALGHGEDAAEYMANAKAMAESWLRRAGTGDCTALTFDGDGWSQKYNLAWDKLLGFGLLPERFYRHELAGYLKHMEPYGLPLDSRSSCTKSDWTMWTASLAEDRETFLAMVRPLAKFLEETPNRVPFSDYYDAASGVFNHFIARSVQGGVFMPLLKQAWAGTH